MTKVKILTDGGYNGQKFNDAIGKVFDASISDYGCARVDLNDGAGFFWTYIIDTECEIVEDEPAEPNYAALAREYGICITTPEGVVYDGRKP